MRWNRSLYTMLALFFLISSSICDSCYAQVECLDQQNKPVDWWMMLKIPQYSDPATSGYSYLYTDANNTMKLYLDTSDYSLDKPRQALAYTLSQIYNQPDSDGLAWTLYDDEPAGAGRSFKYAISGHTKGVVAFDAVTGFWLVHSVPKFPLPPGNGQTYAYPSGEAIYGQSLLCMSLPADEFETIGRQFKYSNPDIYASHISQSMQSLAPDLVDVINGKGIINVPANNTAALYTIQGNKFTNYMQSSPANGVNNVYFYYGYVAPQIALQRDELDENLSTETWQRSPKTDSMCGVVNVGGKNINVRVNNVTKLSWSDSRQSYSWTETKDHSKWVISRYTDNDSGGYTVCIGDINRMDSQRLRGGGTVCFADENIHTRLTEMVGSNYVECGAE